MKFSNYFLKTSKVISKESNIISSELLKRGGFIAESVAGRFYFLPIGHRVQQKIMEIIKQEMDSAGCQEMITPILHPLELWKETNRTDTAGFELMKIKDRRGAEFALGGTAEEMFVDLVRQYKPSYKDLPFHLYQFSPKFRDELRARGGLLRVREFIMKDGYSFHVDEKDFKKEYEKIKKLYIEIFKKLGLKTLPIEADNGYIGGEYCHEFVFESKIGESKYLVTKDNSYAAHEDMAVFEKETENKKEKEKPLTKVEAKRGRTMQDGTELHGLPLWKQIKDVLYKNEKGHFILAVIRGDLDVNEVKLQNITKSCSLIHATDEEIRKKIKSEPGFISPVKIKEKLKNTKIVIVVDDSLRLIKNCYGGANEKNQDFLNINIDRDYKADMEGDIALAKNGYKALNGKGILIQKKGIEVGNIFQLGYHYSNKMKNAIYVDANGKEKPFYMGCYGIGIGRTMASIVENHHDENGIVWPISVAPFQVHLISLSKGEKEAEKIYNQAKEKGIEILYDDRNKSAGEKFADADLIGIPWRVIISEKTIKQKKIEIKKRNEKESKFITLKDFLEQNYHG